MCPICKEHICKDCWNSGYDISTKSSDLHMALHINGTIFFLKIAVSMIESKSNATVGPGNKRVNPMSFRQPLAKEIVEQLSFSEKTL